MTPTPGELPTPQEIERQLARMLASDVFTKRERLSQMLKHIVETTLSNGAKLDEHSLGYAVFENYDNKGSAVRANASMLRTLLGEYYRERAEDPVFITVPAGGYRPVFSYNPRSPADREYRQGCLYVSSFVPSQWDHPSLCQFRKAVAADPNHAPALAARAEAELREAIYKRSVPGHDPLPAAEASAREVLRSNPASWRAHVVLGAFHCCRREWSEAAKAFDAALAVAPRRTREHSWYGAYLLIVGEEEEALRLAGARVEQTPGDLSARIALGLFLYIARRFDEAAEVMASMPEEATDGWLADVLLALVSLANGDAATAQLQLASMRNRLCDPERYPPEEFDGVFPGLQVLAGLKSHNEGSRRLAREKLRDGCGYAFANAADPAHHHDQVMYWTPMQVALGYTGLDEPEETMEALAIALERNDPLAALIHRWPFLDALRGEPGFKALIERTNLA